MEAQHRLGAVLFHVVLLAVVLAFIGASIVLPFRASQLPLLIGVPTLVLLVLSLVGELIPGFAQRFQGGIERLFDSQLRRPSGANGTAADAEQLSFRSFVVGGAWFCLFFGLLLPLGFLAATLLFIPCFLLFFARYPWWQALFYTAVLFIVQWYGFAVLFGLHLWKGTVPELVRNLIGGDILPRFF